MLKETLSYILILAFVLSIIRLLIPDNKNKQIIEQLVYVVFILSIVSFITGKNLEQLLNIKISDDRFYQFEQTEQVYMTLTTDWLNQEASETLKKELNQLLAPKQVKVLEVTITVRQQNDLKQEGITLTIWIDGQQETFDDVKNSVMIYLNDTYSLRREQVNVKLE